MSISYHSFLIQKYAFALDIHEPRIVWCDGPYPASTSDLTIFRGGKKDKDISTWDHDALFFKIPAGKKLVADRGYAGHPAKMRIWIGKVKARQETMHARLKSYKILCNRFYYGTSTQQKMDYHKMATEAIVVLTQYAYENGHPPFDVKMPKC
jgi:hypothetical protein